MDLTTLEINLFTEFIFDSFGYDFRNYAIPSFRRRLSRILELFSLNSLFDLKNLLKKEKSFFSEFLSEVTVNVTEMFRDPSFWEEVYTTVLPKISSQSEVIKIWHAGCSSGEEVFSMLIVLDKLGLLEKTKIVATDIDEEILKNAKEGIISYRNLDHNYLNFNTFDPDSTRRLDYYFEKSKKGLKMKQEYLEKVSFIKHNLVSEDPLSNFDLVLCRNVMIYFDEILQDKVLQKMHKSLYINGYMAIGTKESIMWSGIANKFDVENYEEKIYRKTTL